MNTYECSDCGWMGDEVEANHERQWVYGTQVRVAVCPECGMELEPVLEDEQGDERRAFSYGE